MKVQSVSEKQGHVWSCSDLSPLTPAPLCCRSKEEGGRLYRKLSLPARFGSRGSLRKSPKTPPVTSRPPAPDPPELSGKPPALPPKPPVLLPRTPSQHPSPRALNPNPPKPTPEPPKLAHEPPKPPPKPSPPNPKPLDQTPKPSEIPPNPAEPLLEPRTRILLSNGHATSILQVRTDCTHLWDCR